VEELGQWVASFDASTPWYFVAALGVALAILFLPVRKRTGGLALNLRYWSAHVEFTSSRLVILAALAVAACLLVAAGLADPQVTTKPALSIYGKPVIAVVDISGSMGAAPRRWAGDAMPTDRRNGYEKARDVFNDLIGRRPDVNFALLLYSTERYIARYFTYKNELLADTIDNEKEIADISTGTRTAEALVEARQFLTDHVAGKDKAIVLISDLDGDLEAMLQMSEEMEREVLAGIRVYVIAITSEKKTAVKPAKIDGVEFVAMDDSAGIDRVLREISEMQSAPLRQEIVPQKHSLIPYFALPGLGLVLFAVWLTENRFCKIP
jgi:hypothetical protein